MSSSNYKLEEGNSWIFSSMKPLFDLSNNQNITEEEFEKKMQDIFKEAEKEMFSCKDDLDNQGMFGCEFTTKEDVEKYCDTKNNCIGYLKGYDALKKIHTYIPTKNLPIKNNDEKLKTELGEILFYKKNEKNEKDKILGIDKNTFYIILIVILMVISFIYMTN